MKDKISVEAICTAYMFGAASLGGGVHVLTQSIGYGLVAFGVLMVFMAIGMLISRADL